MLTVLFCLALSSSAHMFLNSPMRFTNENNSPLNGPTVGLSGSNYPCKLGKSDDPNTVYAFAHRTSMALGSAQVLEVMGQATHGGGSCQLSISKDLQPTSASIFKVIHTIQGGCPARNTAGNMGGDANAIDPFHYNYTIPAGLEPGDYTFSWSWVNAVGNREFYQACSPISLTAGPASKRDLAVRDSSAFDALPNLLVANVPESPCSTIESTNPKFPEPGSSVETNDETSPVGFPFKDFVVAAGHDISECYAPFGGSKATVPSAASSVVSSSTPAAVLSIVPISFATMGTSLVAAPTASSVSPVIVVSPSTSAAAMPTYSASNLSSSLTYSLVPTANPSSAAPAASTIAPNSGICPGASQSCPTVGGVICIGNTQFGICNTNYCAVPQLLAAGTICSAGAITKRGLRPKYDKGAKVWVG